MRLNADYNRGFEEGFLMGGVVESINGGFGKGQFPLDGDISVRGGLYIISDILNPETSAKFSGVDFLTSNITTVSSVAEPIASAFQNIGFPAYVTYELSPHPSYPTLFRQLGKINVYPADGWRVEIIVSSSYDWGGTQNYSYSSISGANYYFNEERITALPVTTNISGGFRFLLYSFSDEFVELTGINMFAIYDSSIYYWFHRIGGNFVRFGKDIYDKKGNISQRLSSNGVGTSGTNSYSVMAFVQPTSLSEEERKYSGIYPILLDGEECQDFITTNFRCNTSPYYFYCAKEVGTDNGILFFTIQDFVSSRVAAYILVDAGSQYADYMNTYIQNIDNTNNIKDDLNLESNLNTYESPIKQDVIDAINDSNNVDNIN